MIARIATGSVLGAALSLALAFPASAQSYNAPAGIPDVTAPGGLSGMAGPGNLQRFVDRGGRYGVVEADGPVETGSLARAPRHQRQR